MVQPIDYRIAVQEPVNRTMQAIQRGTDIGQGIMAQRREQQKAQDFNMLINKQNVSPKEIAAMVFKYPELQEQVEGFSQNLSADKRKSGVDRLSKVYASLLGKRPDAASSFLESEAAAAENSGSAEKAKTFRDLSAAIAENPKAAELEIATRLAAMIGPDKFVDSFDKLQRTTSGPEKKPFGFGAQETFQDEEGNLYFGTQKENPNTGQLESVLAPIGNAPKTPVGRVSITGSYGETAEQRSQRLAKEAAEKARLTEEEKLKVQGELMPNIRRSIKQAEVEAAEQGEAQVKLRQMQAALPGVEDVIDRMKSLSDIATYTTAGKVFNTIVKETGFGSTKGATARASLVSILDNQVLPLLKPTFGAAFTAQEGERLRNTLLDPDSGPGERKAALNAFLDQMNRNIETQEREIQLSQQPVQGGESKAGGVLMEDASGNKAIVYPDGSFKEVP